MAKERFIEAVGYPSMGMPGITHHGRSVGQIPIGVICAVVMVPVVMVASGLGRRRYGEGSDRQGGQGDAQVHGRISVMGCGIANVDSGSPWVVSGKSKVLAE